LGRLARSGETAGDEVGIPALDDGVRAQLQRQAGLGAAGPADEHTHRDRPLARGPLAQIGQVAAAPEQRNGARVTQQLAPPLRLPGGARCSG